MSTEGPGYSPYFLVRKSQWSVTLTVSTIHSDLIYQLNLRTTMAFSIRPFEHVRVTFPSRSNRALRSLGRPRAASEIREVLSGSERKKLDTSEDRVFYGELVQS